MNDDDKIINCIMCYFYCIYPCWFCITCCKCKNNVKDNLNQNIEPGLEKRLEPGLEIRRDQHIIV